MRRHTSISILGALLALSAGAPAVAAVCGDADGSGTVSVTDGVRILRTAALLGDACAPGTCDVDGNGAVSVTDGVLTLRIAAGLTVDARCPADDAVAGGVEAIVRESLPFLSGGLGLVVQDLTAAAAVEVQCDNFPAGTIETDGTSIEFDDCAFTGGFVFTGRVDIEAQGGTFGALEIVDPATGRTTTANGRVSFRTAGAIRIVTGAPTLDSALGRYTVTFDDLREAENGAFVGGRVVLDVRDADVPRVDAVTLAFDGDDQSHADVEATLAGGGSRTFVFDFTTGGLAS